MADIAALGIQVDSSQAVTASTNLKGMSSASNTVADSLQKQYEKTLQTSKALDAYNNAINGNIQQQQQLAAAMKTANDNMKAANDNTKSAADAMYDGKSKIVDFASSTLQLALHLKTLLAVLLLVSPAFREFVITQAKLLGGSAVAAAIDGIKDRLGQVLQIVKNFAAPLLLVAAAYEFVKSALDQYNTSVEKNKKLMEDAFKAGVGIDFLQALQKGAEATGLKVDQLTDSLIKFHQQSKLTLEGTSETGAPSSVLLDRINKLQEAGNLQGNTGVADFKGAKDAEERYRAIVKLISEAMDSGNRLAALDIAKNAGFSDEIISKMEMLPHILDDMLRKADAFKETELIDEETVARTAEVEDRLAASLKIIKDFSGPLLDLKSWGLFFRGIWADILDTVAGIVKYIDSILEKTSVWIKSIGSALYAIGKWSGINDALNATFNPNLGGLAGSKPTVTTGPSLTFGPTATAGEISRSERLLRQQQENLPDSSKRPVTSAGGETGDQFTRLAESIRRQTAARKADLETVGLGIEAHEKLRVQYLLEEAAMQTGAGGVEKYRQKIDELSKAAGEVAKELEKAKIQQDIKFGRETAFFTTEDVQIATQLKTLYGDVATAMASVEAQQLRINQNIKAIADLGKDVAQGFGSDFINGLRQGEKAWQSFGQAATNALNKIIDKLMKMAVDNLWMAAFGGSKGGGLGSILGSLFGGGTPGGGSASNLGLSGANNPGWSAPLSAGTFVANGGVFSGPGISAFSGSMVNKPTLFPFAKGVGMMGEAGPEAILPLKRGAGGKLGVATTGGSGGMSIEINNYASPDNDFKPRRESGPDGEKLILDVVKKGFAQGEFDNSQQSAYGIRRRKVR